LQAFAGQYPGKFVALSFVHTKEISDLPGAHPETAPGNVGVLADVTAQFSHKTLAEPHDLIIRFSFGFKIRPALGPAHGHGCQGVFKNLLEGQKFKDAVIDRRMKPQSPLKRPDSAVHFYAKAAIYVHAPLVVHPGHPERDRAFRFRDSLQDPQLAIFRVAL